MKKTIMRTVLIVLTLGLSATITAQSTAPVVVTNSFIARGSTAALGRSTVTGSNITEEGFCYSSTTKTPTIADSKTTEYYERNGKLFYMSGLTPATFYYMRAYAINSNGEVGYGDVVKVPTLPKSNVSFTYTANDATTDQTSRIQAAIDETTELYNTWSGLNTCVISVSYSAGTNTADGSAWSRHINVGPRTGYQRTGTLLHEVNHVMGVGQKSQWTSNSNLRSNTTWGFWLGDRANKMVQFIENNDEVRVYGDGTHMWASGGSPLAYGINGAQEDSGNKLLYIGNVLITHALQEDGLDPPVSYDNGYPYYSVDIEDSVKYYIKNVDESCGLYTSYLGAGNVTLTRMLTTPNDSAAWYLSFNPQNGKYTFRNVATGKYLTHTTQNFNDVIRMNTVVNTSSAQEFQLIPTREDVTVGESWNDFTARPVNICFESYNGLTVNGSYAAPVAYNMANSATAQHWFIMSEDEMKNFQKTVSSLVIDSLMIGGTLYPGFDLNKTNYYIAKSPTDTADSCQLSVVLNSRYQGNCTINQPTSFPGTGSIVLTDTDGDTTQIYTLNFLPNIIYQWNGGNVTGSASKPNLFGWGSTDTYGLLWGSANGINTHYIDPTGRQPYEGYVFNGGHTYDQSRMIMLYFKDAGDTYYYKFTGLKPNTEYSFSTGVAWTNSDVTSPSVNVMVVNGLNDSIPVLDSTSSSVLVNETCATSQTEKDLLPYEFTFITPADVTTDTPFALQFHTADKTRIVLSDLAVVELQPTNNVDVNGDGTVDSQDVLKVYDFMRTATGSEISPIEDVNSDGIVDSGDVLIIYEYMRGH